MSDQMTRLQQEAEKRYLVGGSIDLTYPAEALREHKRAAFIAGRTISKEQVEQAAAAANAMLCQYARDGAVDIEVFDDGMDLEFAMVRAGLEAAGLVIEE